MKKILSFILACSMIFSLGINIRVHADTQESEQAGLQAQQAQDASPVQGASWVLEIVNEAMNVTTNQEVNISVKVDNMDIDPYERGRYIVKQGQNVVITTSDKTKGRKIGWFSKKGLIPEEQEQIDFSESIFKVGDGSVQTEPKTMKAIRDSSDAVDVVSFAMPSGNLKIIIKEINDKIRFYDKTPPSNSKDIHIESPSEHLTHKGKFVIKAMPHSVNNGEATLIPMGSLNYKVYDDTKLSYKDGFFMSNVLGKKADNGEFSTIRTLIIAEDGEGNVGAREVDIDYRFDDIVTKNLHTITIYGHGGETMPERKSERDGEVTYVIADQDRVKVTAKDMSDKDFIGWEVTKIGGATALNVVETGSSGEEEVSEKDMSRYNQKSMTFVFDSDVKKISPIYKEAGRYQITVAQKAKDKANIVIQPKSDDLEAQTQVTIIATPKDANKKVKKILYTYENRQEEKNYIDGGININMHAFDVTITDVELEDIVKPNPNPNPPSSNDNSDSESSSGSGTNSSVERISPNSKNDKKMEDSKKAQDEKKDSNEDTQPEAPQTPQAPHSDKAIEEVFNDVKSDDWFAKSVAFVKEYDLMRGTDEKHFAPNEKTSRAMLITILHRLSGSVQVEEKAQFKDVKVDEYFAKALDWAIQNEIVKGFEDGTFRGNDVITRERVAIMLFQYAKANKKDVSKRANLMKFSDEKEISSYAQEALKWAHAQGLILGKGENLAPKGNATRAEIATIIMRLSDQLQK